jgi:hypothetical protein
MEDGMVVMVMTVLMVEVTGKEDSMVGMQFIYK